MLENDHTNEKEIEEIPQQFPATDNCICFCIDQWVKKMGDADNVPPTITQTGIITKTETETCTGREIWRVYVLYTR